MNGAVLVAMIAALPPALAALLAFLSAQSSDRRAALERAAVMSTSLETLAEAVQRLDHKVDRLETKIDRVESGIVELRERVAHLEAASATYPRSSG